MKLAKDREAGDAAALEATRQELLSVYNRYKILWVPLVQRWQFLLDSPSTWRQCTTETERALQLASEQAIPNPFELRVLGKVYEFDVKELTQRINNGSRKLRVQPLDAVLTEADFRTESKIDEAKLFMRYLSTKLDLPEDSEPVIAQFKIGFGLRSEDDAKKIIERCRNRIISGTLSELQERVVDTEYLSIDTTYVEYFLKTVSTFTKPENMLEFFRRKFAPQPPASGETKAPDPRALIEWSRRTKLELSRSAQTNLEELLRTSPYLSPDQVNEALQPLPSELAVEAAKNTSAWERLRGSSKDNLLKKQLALVAAELARRLAEIIKGIDFKKELLCSGYGLSTYSNWMNRLSSLVTETILTESCTLPQAKKAIEFWQDVVIVSFKHKNLATVISVLAAFEDTALYRLRKVSKIDKLLTTNRKFNEVVVKVQLTGLKTYSQLAQWMNPPLLPFVGTTLTVIEQNMSARKDERVDGVAVIDFDRRRKVAETIRRVEDFQTSIIQNNYPRAPDNPDVRCCLASAMLEPAASRDVLLERSFALFNPTDKIEVEIRDQSFEGYWGEWMELFKSTLSRQDRASESEEEYTVNQAAIDLRLHLDETVPLLRALAQHYGPSLLVRYNVAGISEVLEAITVIRSAAELLKIVATRIQSWNELAVCVLHCLELGSYYAECVARYPESYLHIQQSQHDPSFSSQHAILASAHRMKPLGTVLQAPTRHFKWLIVYAQKIAKTLSEQGAVPISEASFSIDWDGCKAIKAALELCQEELDLRMTPRQPGIPWPPALEQAMLPDISFILVSRVKLKPVERSCQVCRPFPFVLCQDSVCISRSFSRLQRCFTCGAPRSMFYPFQVLF
eukprot:c18994_g1_i4.p1 GENE.c18994_g1_i4~~c18994_g1_i4.p1  ORF type:complete len:899 (+),score=135.15 c18994_g1_i4:147-2699(+)